MVLVIVNLQIETRASTRVVRSASGRSFPPCGDDGEDDPMSRLGRDSLTLALSLDEWRPGAQLVLVWVTETPHTHKHSRNQMTNWLITLEQCTLRIGRTIFGTILVPRIEIKHKFYETHNKFHTI